MMNTKCNHSKGDMKVEAKSSSSGSCGKFIEVVIMLILIGSYYCSTTVNIVALRPEELTLKERQAQELNPTELREELLARAYDPLVLLSNSNNPYNYLVFYQDQPSQINYMQQPQPNNNFIPQTSFNMNYMQQPMPYPEDITDPTTAMNMVLALMAKAFKLNYLTPTNNNQRISSNPRNRQIAQPGMNLGQDRQIQMNSGVQNVGNHNGLIVVLGIANPNANQNGNGNVVAAQAEVNGNGNNENQIRCYNCRGMGHLVRNCTVRPRRMDVAYLSTQLLIAQKKEAGI
ncbi:integrase, catalytic region, zinc finger, CCHC-type containing protein [Tanacetum coccineum]